LISSVTGLPVGPEEMSGAGYWRRQLRQPVKFRQAIEGLRGDGALRGNRIFVEAGPGTTLAGLGRRCFDREDAFWATSLRKARGEWHQMLASLGGLYVRGVEVDWAGFDRPYTRRRVSLPTYPFERQRYWIEASAADPEKQWEYIRESASRQAGHGRLDLNVAQYPERWTWLDQLTSAYIVAALRQLGVFENAGERHSVESLMARSGIRESYGKLIGRWLRKLASEGLLAADGMEFLALRRLPVVEIAPLLAEAGRAFSGDRILLDYASACGKDLAAILTGQTSALETLFPGGAFDRAEDIYERAPLSAYFSSLARAALEGFLRTGRPDTLRVLEIGAGTGATTSALLPALPPETTAYYFTDVSGLFLHHAERKFADYPFVRYGHFDIECDGETDSYPKGSFDVIVATNVLHATKDLRRTAAHVRALLAPGGILILCESTSYLPWFDITTALIEGWQRFDDGLRDDHPLIDSEAWKALLEGSGFDRVMAFPGEDSPARVLGQHVFVARAALGETPAPRRPRVAADVRAAVIQKTNEIKTNQIKTSEIKTGEVKIPPMAAWSDVPEAERHESLVALVRVQLAEMLRFDSPDRIDRKRRLMDLGLDSLMAVELRGRLAGALGLEKPLSATIAFDYPTLDALADHLEDVIVGPEPASLADPLAGRADELEHLDDEEVEALLLKKLQSF